MPNITRMLWIEITVRSPEDALEAVRALLESHGLERMEEVAGRRRQAGWRGYVLWDLVNERVPARVQADLKAIKGRHRVSQRKVTWKPPAPGWILDEPLDVWGPDPIGERVTLIGSTQQSYDARPGELVVRLQPSRAFGNGAHQTTRLCTRALERFLKPGDRVMDVGTGTGVLAIIAARLGASEVFAVDMEPEAVESARVNIANNHLQDFVHVECGEGLDGVNFGPVDLVICNIMPWAIEAVTPDVMRHLRVGGHYVLSGVRDYQVKGLDAAIMHHGLNIVDVTLDATWTCLVYRRDEVARAPDLAAWKETRNAG